MGGARRGKLWLVVSLLAAVLAGPLWAISANAIATDFVDEIVLSGLTYPTNVEFAPDGRVFVTEKSGVIKVYDSLTDPTPDVFADLSAEVHDFWDRGMLGLAIDPDFPTDPYIYVLYTYDAKPGGSHPTWGDACPTPPGATTDGCVVTGRLSRLTANGNTMVAGSELVLIQDWCQQFPSHSIGDLEFGADGALYASGGDGASFTLVDYGQFGTSGGVTVKNPCADPPAGFGGTMTPPTAEGGAIRSQDLRTSSDPVTLDGTVIRVNPTTGLAFAGNPGSSNPDPNGKRIVAYGLRNPFRFVIKPGTNQLFIGDVGWSTWEEVDHHPDPTTSVKNFGWPCYEGGSGTSIKMGGYDAANLDVCENLYTAGSSAVTASLFAYDHSADITGSDACPPASPPQGTSSSISGLAFYSSGGYPGTYNGALFGSDYSRNCIWVMYPGSGGTPDPSTVEIFQHLAAQPVDLEAGPGGDIFYVSFNQTGSIRRLRFVGTNTPPNAVITATPTSGNAPLLVDFGSSGSSDPDGDALTFTWDLDNDGAYDDGTGPTAQWTYTTPGTKTARLKATDARGEVDTDSVTILVSNSPPVPVIDTPTAGTLWSVGDSVGFSGHATDPDQGTLPAASLSWGLVLHHCAEDGTCHVHPLQTFSGVASGSFTAPDHEYPSWLDLTLTATDQFGSAVSVTRQLDPRTVDITLDSSPQGLELSLGGATVTTPVTKTVIVNSLVTIGAQTQTHDGVEWVFRSWSDGGAGSHTVTAPSSAATYTAFFDQPEPASCDFNDDGYADLAVGVMNESSALLDAGAVEIIPGSATGLTATGRQMFNADSPGVNGNSKKGDRFGAALACGDFDGDGFRDLAIGAPGNDFGGYRDAGSVTVLYGSASGLTGIGDQLIHRATGADPGTVVIVKGHARTGDALGSSLTAADYDGDGFDDLIIGAPDDNVQGVRDAGSIDVVYGSADGLDGSRGRLFHRGSKGIKGSLFADAWFGRALVAGDFDGDGYFDLAVGAPGADTAGVAGSGAVNVIIGTADGLKAANDRLLSQATPGIPGALSTGNRFGLALATGDFDGSGQDDLAISVDNPVSGKAGAGSVIVVGGSPTGLVGAESMTIDRDQPGIKGVSGKNDDFGSSLTAADFDGDGHDDLAIGAPGDNHGGFADLGAVNVVYGTGTGLADPADQLWRAGADGLGGTPGAFLRFGQALSAADYDADGAASLAIGSLGDDVAGAEGAITVVEGTASGLTAVGSSIWTSINPALQGLFGYRLP